MDEKAELIALLLDVMGEIKADIVEVFEAQGHKNTGRSIKTMTYTVEETPGGAVGRLYGEDYLIQVDAGVKSENIPFTPGSRRGGTSKYIQGLIEFFEYKGLSEREALGAAIATATVQSREGMPTRASSAFSSTGERVGFLTRTLEKKIPTIRQMIENKYGAVLELRFAEGLRRDGIKTAA